MNELVSVEWLKEHLYDENIIILDASLNPKVEETSSTLSLKTIPKSIFFDIKNNFTNKNSPFPNTLPTSEMFGIECRKLGINKTSKIVVFDNLVYSSPRVWWLFKIMGHSSISVLNGGLPEWIRKGFLIVKRNYYNFEIGNFESSLQNQFVKTYQNILLNTINKSFSIIYARSKERFDGTGKEPRKHLKSGHIPNSINIHYKEVLDNCKFKSVIELKKVFEDKCFNTENLVFSCGSEITACIVMMACEISYRKSKQIYDGSWSEWAELQNLKENVV